MGLFTRHQLKKLQQAIINSDLITLKKQFTRLDNQLIAEHRFSFNELQLNAAELAIHAMQPAALQHLLQAGAGSVSSQNDPLIYQALQQPDKSLGLLTALLQADTPLDYPEHDIIHVLFACFRYCPPGALMLHISRLNEYGADLNTRDKEGLTVLLLALHQEMQPLVQLLINSGARLDDNIAEGWCSREIIDYAKRCADDLRIRQMMLG